MSISKEVIGLDTAIAFSNTEEKKMLEEVGVIKKKSPTYILNLLNDFIFTELGWQVTTMCEELYNPEDYETREDGASVWLSQLFSERF